MLAERAALGIGDAYGVLAARLTLLGPRIDFGHKLPAGLRRVAAA